MAVTPMTASLTTATTSMAAGPTTATTPMPASLTTATTTLTTPPADVAVDEALRSGDLETAKLLGQTSIPRKEVKRLPVPMNAE
jgi:hypothetical protein